MSIQQHLQRTAYLFFHCVSTGTIIVWLNFLIELLRDSSHQMIGKAALRRWRRLLLEQFEAASSWATVAVLRPSTVQHAARRKFGRRGAPTLTISRECHAANAEEMSSIPIRSSDKTSERPPKISSRFWRTIALLVQFGSGAPDGPAPFGVSETRHLTNVVEPYSSTTASCRRRLAAANGQPREGRHT